ncbi:hypothetical protein [Rhizobium sp. PAMB 3182]|jgi:hypothetical protein
MVNSQKGKGDEDAVAAPRRAEQNRTPEENLAPTREDAFDIEAFAEEAIARHRVIFDYLAGK